MSSAVFPLGMNSMPSSGYNHNSTYYNKEYISWKGSGVNSNPSGVASGHIRPLTNKDPGNVFQTGFGLPRPIKHYRKGRGINSQPIKANNLHVSNPYNSQVSLSIDEQGLINYNTNRYVKSSTGTSLGSGFGGTGLLNDMQDKPGSYVTKLNPESDLNPGNNAKANSNNGIKVVVDYYPNNNYLQNNPDQNTTNRVLCCNNEIKAKRRAIYASTNIKPNYYTTHFQYLQNRCNTYQQKSFNFASNEPSKGSDTYLSNCQLNAQLHYETESILIERIISIMLKEDVLTQLQISNLKITTILNFVEWLKKLSEPSKTKALNTFTTFINNPYTGMPFEGPQNLKGCQYTVYKPNNPQYATQGAVDSSTRNLKLKVTTISTNAASLQKGNNTGNLLINANDIHAGNSPNYINMNKQKAPKCEIDTPYPFQNKKRYSYSNLKQYQFPKSNPVTYRYFPGTPIHSNHFSQKPRTYNVHTS